MRSRPQLRLTITRHEGKEQKLKEFILDHLADPSGEHAVHRTDALLVVARSIESPVVAAIAGIAKDVAAAGMGVRLILAQMDPESLPEAFTTTGQPSNRLEVRWLTSSWW
jgi:hypothetical protein